MRAAFALLTLLLFTLFAQGCAVLDGVGTSEDDLTFEPNVLGANAQGQPKPLTPQQALDLRSVSHDKILTWEGIVEDFEKPTAKVHLIDTKRFDGHLGYTRKALGRGDQLSEAQFQTEIQFPATRRYMPFLVFDFRSDPITVNGKRFKWVMNIRRYNYRDTEPQLAVFLANLRTMLSERLMKSFGEPVLFVYDSDFTFANGNKRRPHVSQLADVKSKSFDTITEGKMIEAAGAKLVSVLNPGVAFGFVSLVKADADPATAERLTPRHIAIFQDTPERVPPVSGIVTLEPQTPLSHVNLLARNRGTPNVSTAQIGLIPGMEALIGKLARMEALANGTINLRAASMEEATAFWNARQTQALEVPRVQPISLEPVEFVTADSTTAIINNIGSKAANYATIQKLLGPTLVKPGFGLSFAHYRGLIAGSPAEPLIADLIAKKDTLAPEEIDARLVAIRDAIKKNSPAPAIAQTVSAIRAVAAKLNVPRIRFRSSTNSEDLPVFNGAGLYESVGFDVADDDAKLAKEFLKVMSSLWLERAFWERELFGIKHADVAMAILINPAFSNEFANGVVVGTRENNTFSSWINAQSGEASVTNPLDGEVPESFTMTLQNANLGITKLDSRSNIANVFLDEGKDALKSTLDAQLKQLHAATEQLHKHFVAERLAAGDTRKYGIDIEYKLMRPDGESAVRLFVKQSRLLSLEN